MSQKNGAGKLTPKIFKLFQINFFSISGQNQQCRTCFQIINFIFRPPSRRSGDALSVLCFLSGRRISHRARRPEKRPKDKPPPVHVIAQAERRQIFNIQLFTLFFSDYYQLFACLLSIIDGVFSSSFYPMKVRQHRVGIVHHISVARIHAAGIVLRGKHPHVVAPF